MNQGTDSFDSQVKFSQAFSQTLKSGCPRGTFPHKIIRD